MRFEPDAGAYRPIKQGFIQTSAEYMCGGENLEVNCSRITGFARLQQVGADVNEERGVFLVRDVTCEVYRRFRC